MKILIRQFLGKAHSWSSCGWGLATAFKELGHQVDLFSTDGIKHLPPSLLENVIGYTEENQQEVVGKLPNDQYDCQISYTCLKNFNHIFAPNVKNKFGLWVFEWAGNNILPTGFAKQYKYCDFLCPPSNFGKKIFVDSHIPEEKIKVIPHGINAKQYRSTSTIVLPTKKKFKILANIQQNHLRKNIPGLLDAYGKAFTNKDDVCLILKAKDKPVTHNFEISLSACINNFKQKYPNHSELKIFSEFVEDISALYRSIDAVFSLSHCEGFYFPQLEAMASGKLSICPNYGGQLDLANETNSLLISGKEVRADPKSMYWECKSNAICFAPSVDDAVGKLRYAYNNYEKLNEAIDKQRQNVYDNYDWKIIANQFLKLCHD